jgi:parallel beta-helix repeat protein
VASPAHRPWRIILPFALAAIVAGVAVAAASRELDQLQPETSASATGPRSAASDCTSSFQALIDAAPARSTVLLPGCIARETVVVGKPLTLVGAPGAEVRGSDVWTGWQSVGALWISSLSLPLFQVNGTCRPGTSRCLWPEQVFVDGTPLEQTAAGTEPGPGQFSLDNARHVVLAATPIGHVVEVTTRVHWIEPEADGIVIAGLRMRHAADPAQDGAISDGGHLVSIRDCVMSDTHGAVVSLTGRGALTGNEIFRGGQLGIHGGGAVVENNRIHDNNTEGFDWGWEAGGLKSNRPDQLIDGNAVYGNAGPGIWVDGGEGSHDILSNQVHDNSAAGILYEISSRGRIGANRAWANGGGDSAWGWGGGIVISSSADVEIDHNVLAWNADGIAVISQRRDDAPKQIEQINVHDNVVAASAIGPDAKQKYALAWLEDWTGDLFAPGSGNRGTGNLFWYPDSKDDAGRFAWNGDVASLSAFDATPGGAASRYLTDAEGRATLAAAGVPETAP